MRLEEILRERNLTKKAFCDMLNMLPQNMNSSMKNPTVATLEKWASALDIPLWQLFSSPDEVFKELPSHVVTKNPFTCPYCGKELHIKIE